MAYIGNRPTSAPFITDTYTGNGSQTAFLNLSFAPAAPSAIAVYVNGSYQTPASDYSVSGTTLNFSTAPALSAEIVVLHLGVGAATVTTVADESITTAKLANSSVTTDKIANTAVTIAKISASGTASNTTFLRGDAAWEELTIPPTPDAPDIEVFTSPGTWTKPATVRRIKVTVVGGGGKSISPVGGAGGGGAAIKYIPAPSIPGPVSVTVGLGGGTAYASISGNTSSFGAFASATGGGGNYGSGGVGSGGDLNIQGGNFTGQSGGSSILGGTSSLQVSGKIFGGGSGAGGGPVNKIGAPGVVIVEEFY